MVDLDGTDALLLIGDSERSADLLYATRFSAPDPFVFLQTERAKYLLVGDLELDRARDQARVDEVLSLSRYDKLAAERQGEADEEEDSTRRYRALMLWLEELEVRSLKVPADFPIGAADALRRGGLRLEVAPDPLFAHRSRKEPAEVDAIRQALRAAEREEMRPVSDRHIRLFAALAAHGVDRCFAWLDASADPIEPTRHPGRPMLFDQQQPAHVRFEHQADDHAGAHRLFGRVILGAA